MADLPTSENPQIENLGLPISDTTPSDPSPTDQIPHSDDEENAIAEETEFRNAIEKELSQLAIEQAQIERSQQQQEEEEKEDENFDGEAVKDENFDENVEEEEEKAGTNGGRYNNNNRRRVCGYSNYPMRPEAEDCGYYMKFGSCKFGLNCKFNHPSNISTTTNRRKPHHHHNHNQGGGGNKERWDHRGEENSSQRQQTECKYYLTPGGCKFGNDCKFSHVSEKSSVPQFSELNFLGLPVRPGEKECTYYMRTGSCKYGPTCRFHHPDPTTVNGGDSPSGFGNGGSLPSKLVSSSPVSSWSSPRAYNESSPFVPTMFPPTQGAHASNSEWNGYQASAYPTPERSLPTPPAFAMNNLPPDMNFSMPHHQHDLALEEYPERPGEQECSFFLKTGDCKFRSNCKFHHPKSHSSRPKPNTYALNDKGLPLRPDQPICTHYQRYGICKYGPACKYDHPSQFGILPPPFERPPFGNVNIVDGTEKLRGNEN